MKQSVADTLGALEEHIAEVIDGLFEHGFIDFDGDADVVDTLAVAGRVLRRVEGVLTEAVGEVVKRSETGMSRRG